MLGTLRREKMALMLARKSVIVGLKNLNFTLRTKILHALLSGH